MFAQAVVYYCLYHIDHRKGLNKPMEGKYDHQIKQNNGKENVIIRLTRTVERKMCLNTYVRGISFPKTSRARYP